MTNDIKELRKLAVDCYWPTSPVSINKLLDRLEAAEKDVAMKDQVIDLLGAAAKAEIDALRTQIAAMEQQEPVGTTEGMPGTTGFTMACFHADKVPIGSKLYALHGATNPDCGEAEHDEGRCGNAQCLPGAKGE